LNLIGVQQQGFFLPTVTKETVDEACEWCSRKGAIHQKQPKWSETKLKQSHNINLGSSFLHCKKSRHQYTKGRGVGQSLK